MRLFNTLTRRKEEVTPLRPGRIGMYTCGPTVYRYIHIGNLRTFCMADWLRRALEREGYEVTHVKNITDVGHMRQELLDQGEDKLEAQARREGRTAAEIAEFYTSAFHRDERRMNILPATAYPRATHHIQDMIEMVRALEAKGLAYHSGANVYFDVQKFAGYGTLSGNQLEAMLQGVREGTASEKRHPEDFPLWKAAEPGREMAWDSPWGRGFPGWHIECSAMATRYLGEEIDIHTGGVDNIFPHHENEIAQSEGYTGRRWVRHWIHAQHLLTDGLKMAKSVSNDYTLDDIIARGFEPMALRYLFTTAHYRSHLNFTFTALASAQTALRRLRLAARSVAGSGDPDPDAMRPWREEFDAALSEDLNLPRAMAVVWDVVRRSDLGPAERRALLRDFDSALALDVFVEPDSGLVAEPGGEIGAILVEHSRARAAREYARADALRAEIEAGGYEVRDGRDSTRLYRRRLSALAGLLASSSDAPDHIDDPDRYEWSVNLIARNSREDLDRCLRSLARNLHGRRVEAVVIDNGSTDDTLRYLLELEHRGRVVAPEGGALPVKVLFADHNLGFAAARNATMRASEGRYVVWLDTSIEITGDVWTPLEEVLRREEVGVVGPFGLVTQDLREFEETEGPDADAIEGYLIAFRRELLREVGLVENEKFRFYRLADIYYSFFFKAAGLRALVVPEVARRLVRHPHREWYSLLPEERQTKSKQNYDLFRERWHHGESLLVANQETSERWIAHDHPRHLEASHFHSPEELPEPGRPHVHAHRHLPDHEHTHPHRHDARDAERIVAQEATWV